MNKAITIRERGEGRYDLSPAVQGACYDVANAPAARLAAEVAALVSSGFTVVAAPPVIDRLAAAGADVSQIRAI